MNRTALIAAILAISIVTVGAVQIVSGRSDEPDDEFPEAVPYTEPTPTATMPSLPSADVPGNDLDHLPRYPESVRVAYSTTSTTEASRVQVTYVTLDPLEPANEHVRNIVSTFGWSVASEEFLEHQQSFLLTRDGEEAHIRLNREDGVTTMGIDYTRREPQPAEPVVDPEPEPVEDSPSQPESEQEPPPPADVPPVDPADSDKSDEKPDDKPEHKPENEDNESGKNRDKPEDHPSNNGNPGRGNDDEDEGGNNGNGNRGGDGEKKDRGRD